MLCLWLLFSDAAMFIFAFSVFRMYPWLPPSGSKVKIDETFVFTSDSARTNPQLSHDTMLCTESRCRLPRLPHFGHAMES